MSSGSEQSSLLDQFRSRNGAATQEQVVMHAVAVQWSEDTAELMNQLLNITESLLASVSRIETELGTLNVNTRLAEIQQMLLKLEKRTEAPPAPAGRKREPYSWRWHWSLPRLHFSMGLLWLLPIGIALFALWSSWGDLWNALRTLLP